MLPIKNTSPPVNRPLLVIAKGTLLSLSTGKGTLGKGTFKKRHLSAISLTASKLCEDIYEALDEALKTGIPSEMSRQGC